ncbi:MAG: hypothetical protein QQW96_24335 [Tychonema bourrellyi B0820]|uniref:hypothetical protein n=1 Tax=Tychonema bourrellyi TaxID=54313 RepID=UPI00117C336F|nr:hypothetical protein [Tychonema bourrellyi]MDQ2100761.1 hypothetical protein [Tychonema bourrellyi B0820]
MTVGFRASTQPTLSADRPQKFEISFYFVGWVERSRNPTPNHIKSNPVASELQHILCNVVHIILRSPV